MVVGGVETGALEDDANRLKDLFQGLLLTFGAARERLVAKGLLLVELHTAIITTIGIDWHGLLLSYSF